LTDAVILAWRGRRREGPVLVVSAGYVARPSAVRENRRIAEGRTKVDRIVRSSAILLFLDAEADVCSGLLERMPGRRPRPED